MFFKTVFIVESPINHDVFNCDAYRGMSVLSNCLKIFSFVMIPPLEKLFNNRVCSVLIVIAPIFSFIQEEKNIYNYTSFGKSWW